jgi:hypothetical protein
MEKRKTEEGTRQWGGKTETERGRR